MCSSCNEKYAKIEKYFGKESFEYLDSEHITHLLLYEIIQYLRIISNDIEDLKYKND